MVTKAKTLFLVSDRVAESRLVAVLLYLRQQRVLITSFHPRCIFCFTVTVPQGIQPGQTIAVMAPDGSRLVKATIPPGLNPGDSFLVRLASPIQSDVLGADPVQPPPSKHPNFADALDNWLTPTPDPVVKEYGRSDNSITEANCTEADIVEAVATPVHEVITPSKSPSVQKVPGQPVNAHVEQAETRHERSFRNPILTNSVPEMRVSSTSPSNQKLLLVRVPQGMTAGATMQVEIPGENRTLTAQVPPGVQSFHVAYTPRAQIPRPPIPSPQQAPPSTPHQVVHPQNPSGQKLLLVRVPPGTPAGTTLHVSVPDEPGRILAAQVPPGNVQEFHVSYEARLQQQHSPASSRQARMMPPTYASGNTAPSHYHNNNNNTPAPNGYHNQYAPPPTPSDRYQQQQYPVNGTPNNNNNYNQRNDGGGSFFPFVGGAALGAAGVAIYDHFAQQQTNNNNYDNGGGDDTAVDMADYPQDYNNGTADYDAADYGGDDYGGGGFDF